jgi:type I restriction-modification system DNA methylase subunit/restriction endonuclease S subunit
MSKQYTCELCKKVFQQKIDFTRHQSKKTACVSLDEIQQIAMKKEEKMGARTELNNVFKRCLDILRDNEGLTGEKALRNMSSLLILKLLEPHFRVGGEIDIANYDFSAGLEEHFDECLIEHNKQRLLTCVLFSNLSKEKEDNIPQLMKYIWDIILSCHPATKCIFLKGRGFDIRHQSTYKKIIDKLNAIDLSQTDYDVLGEAYEEVIQDIMTGKVLGQFFTQPSVKKMMVRLIDPQVREDGTCESCADPTMGTGGFLISYLQTIMKQAKTRNITLNWDYITTTGLYGKELEPDTYQLAVSNMLISSGHMFGGLDCGDSIRQPITQKFDNILANPPFGIKGLKYDDFQSTLKSQYVPVKTDNAVSLFIQAIIYMLKIGGKCAVVLPDGQDLFSKTNTTLVAIREYLMKTCDLKEIIYLPSGIFTYTSIKTCVFYFVKKREGSDALEVKINVSKTQKETGRDYKFSKTHQTAKVAFYDYNPYEGEGVKNLLVEVPIEKIASNSYSLNYAEYMNDDAEEEPQYEEGVVVKTLGEVCEFQNGSQLDKKDIVEGNIPIFGGGVKIVGFHNNNNRNGNETIVCGTGYPGYVNYSFGKPFWASQCFTMKSNNTSIMVDKYLYYYSKIVLEPEFMSKQKGTAQKFIRFNQITDIKIPIPSLERQQEIVKYLDFIYEKANKTSREKIAELKQLNEFCLNNQKIFGENVVKTLGEVCEKIHSGKYNSKDCKSVGKYPFYTNKVNNPEGYTDEYCFDYEKYFILIKDGGAGDKKYGDHIGLGKIFKVYGKSAGTSHQYALIPKKEFDYDYLYQYLKFIKNEIMDLAHYTTGLGCIKKGNIEGLKIPIPSLERQQEIVAYCESNDALIQQLEIEIENNKKQAQLFIDGIVNSQLQILTDSSEEESITTQEGQDENDSVVSPVSSSSSSAMSLTETKPKTRKFIVKKSLP